MSIPSPQERPDLYDFGDVPADSKPLSAEYMKAAVPEHIQKLMADRQAKKKPAASDKSE